MNSRHVYKETALAPSDGSHGNEAKFSPRFAREPVFQRFFFFPVGKFKAVGILPEFCENSERLLVTRGNASRARFSVRKGPSEFPSKTASTSDGILKGSFHRKYFPPESSRKIPPEFPRDSFHRSSVADLPIAGENLPLVFTYSFIIFLSHCNFIFKG